MIEGRCQIASRLVKKSWFAKHKAVYSKSSLLGEPQELLGY